MRVALDGLGVDPGRAGGDTTYVRALVGHLPLADDELELTVFVNSASRAQFPASHPRVHYVECPVPTRSIVLRALWEQAVLPTLVRRARPDVFHAPINVSPLSIDTRSVLTIHEAEPFMPDNQIPWPLLVWWRQMRAASARRAQLILTVSDSARHDVLRWMNIRETQVRVIPLAVDHARFSPDGARRARVEKRPFILWVGRAYPHKGLLTLVRAFCRLRHMGHNEVLVLAGPPGWADAAMSHEIRAQRCGEAVLRFPSIGDDLPDWYRAARAFVFPSDRESFGLPILEALACGTPTVAGDIPALREVGGDAVVYVPPNNPESLVAALDHVLSDGDTRTRLAAAGPRQAARFSWLDTARKTSVEYRRLCADGRVG